MSLRAAVLFASVTYVFDGTVPADGERFFYVPFDVTVGAIEIEVQHDDLLEENILDWGLYDPAGEFRGWGGGNTEPAIIGLDAASRSYLPGPLPAGTWNVLVGEAKLETLPGGYHLEIFVRTSNETLAPQPERAPYVASPALETGARWYAGDFHVHSVQSGDARPPLDEIATFARGRGLDFVALSDHNTTSTLDFIVDAQSRHDALLLIPSVEWTTYEGHANAIGATEWVDHKTGFGGATFEDAAAAFAAQGALLTINHPALELGNGCIGCAWGHAGAGPLVGAVEIATGGYSQSGYIFNAQARAFWDALLDEGHHLAALGGSDDHRAGVGLTGFQSPIGDPTTLVYASELSVAGIQQGIRDGRTVVKLQGPADPMIDLTTEPERVGDTVEARRATFSATVTGALVEGNGNRFRWVIDGVAGEEEEIDSDPWTARVRVDAPLTGSMESRVRAEVLVVEPGQEQGDVRTVTGHAWVKGDGIAAPSEGGKGCGCAVTRPTGAWPSLVVFVFVFVTVFVFGRARSSRRTR